MKSFFFGSRIGARRGVYPEGNSQTLPRRETTAGSPARKAFRAGFTIVEMLVAITIIALVSGVSYQGYSSFENAQKDRAVTRNVENLIRSLDRQVANDTITSYVITFSSGTLGAVVATNTYRLTVPLKIASFDWATLSGSIDMSGLSDNPGFRTVVDGKITETTIGSWGLSSVAFDFPLGTHEKFELIGFNDTAALNNFRFELYEPSSMLAPIDTRPTLGFEDASLTGVVLKNFRSKKTLESAAGIRLESAKLVFGRLGRTATYVISPND
jgi:prepilin-type N-terminal cleavage/methylation domain-containing protein